MTLLITILYFLVDYLPAIPLIFRWFHFPGAMARTLLLHPGKEIHHRFRLLPGHGNGPGNNHQGDMKGEYGNETDISVHGGMDSIVYGGTGISTGRRLEHRGYGVDHRSHGSCDDDDACRTCPVLRGDVQV